MVEDLAFIHKIDYITILQEILNLKGHPNRISDGDFAEWVDLANLWSFSFSFSGLQPTQQACFISKIHHKWTAKYSGS